MAQPATAQRKAGAHASLADIRHFYQYFSALARTEIQSDIDFVASQGDGKWHVLAVSTD